MCPHERHCVPSPQYFHRAAQTTEAASVAASDRRVLINFRWNRSRKSQSAPFYSAKSNVCVVDMSSDFVDHPHPEPLL